MDVGTFNKSVLSDNLGFPDIAEDEKTRSLQPRPEVQHPGAAVNQNLLRLGVAHD